MRLNNAISLDTVKKALEDKDKALAAAQKVAREKTEAADKRLAAADKLEAELKKLKQERGVLSDKVKDLTTRGAVLEKCLSSFAEKMYKRLEGTLLYLFPRNPSNNIADLVLLPSIRFLSRFRTRDRDHRNELGPCKLSCC